MYFDTHCHLDDPSLSFRLEEVLAAARQVGVTRFIVPGVGPEGWDDIASLAGRERGIYPAFGIHPMLADRATDGNLARLSSLVKGAVAIGEIGLDYAVSEVPREVQLAAFRAQLRIAVDAGVPVLIHCRRAFEDLLGVLREEGVQRVGGVMHAFSGSPEVARQCLRLGLLISVSGTVTYRNAVRPVEVVRQLPLDSLLLETDAPDMTPEPHRGRGNEPAFMVETALKVAQVKGMPPEEVARVTTANAERLFRL